MKRIISIAMLASLLFILVGKSFAQEELPPVTVKAVTYKYLTAVGHKDAPQKVKMLERRAAEFDIKSADFYEEDYENYFVSFYIPDGQILASYDKDGNLLSTVEKYKDIQLPPAIQKAVVARFPGWQISKDAYRVNYYEKNNVAKRQYKLILENGDKRLHVKLNEKGDFLK